MAAGGDRFGQTARRLAGEVVKDAARRLAAEARPPPLPRAPSAPVPPLTPAPAAAAAATSAPVPATPPPTAAAAPVPASATIAAPTQERPTAVAGQTEPTGAADSGTAFRSSIAYLGEMPAAALVIACNSYLFLPQTLEFLEKGLGLRGFDLLALPGGMQWLALPDLLPKHHRVSRWAVEYLLRKHQIKRVIGIAHQACSAYEDESTLGSLARLATGRTTDEHQRDHLLHVGRDLQASFGVTVELYFAAVEEGRTVVFRRLDLPPA